MCQALAQVVIRSLLIVSGDVELNPSPVPTTSLMEGLAALGTAALSPPWPDPEYHPYLVCRQGCEVKELKKLQLVEATLIAIERLLPNSCSECQEEYTVTGKETTSLQQGFHQECLTAHTGSETFPKFPGKLLWLCSGCEP